VRLILLLLVTWVSCSGQTGLGTPAFDAASVKVSDPSEQSRGMMGQKDPGRITYIRQTLTSILMQAYGLPRDRIVGPAWLDKEEYDVVATKPPGTSAGDLKLMLQALLAERFALVTHHAPKTTTVYELTIAKGGMRLRAPEKSAAAPSPAPASATVGAPTLDKNGDPQLPPGRSLRRIFELKDGRLRVSARMRPLADLIKISAVALRSEVVDKTGLTGQYDFDLDLWPGYLLSVQSGSSGDAQPSASPLAPEASDPMNYPSFATAVEQQLGLKLQAVKGTVDVLYVDHVEKIPTQN
jgi:uncharacterized protein (TIGR03435 family)